MTVTISDKESNTSNGYNYSTSNDLLIITRTGALIGQQGEGIENFGDNNATDNSGYIFGGIYGIELDGTGDTVTNEKSGVITGSGAGIFTFGGNSIVNHGTITGYEAVDIEGNTASSLMNDGTISGAIAIVIDAVAGVTVSNGGTLNGQLEAIQVQSPSATIHNTGTINGDVAFASGTNVFDGNGGTVNGDIIGGTGADTIDLTHQTVNGMISAGAGGDAVIGGAGADIIDGGAGDDHLVGGGGVNTVSYASATAGVIVGLALQGAAQNTVGAGSDTLSGFERLVGSNYADTLVGDTLANVIAGGSGNDTIKSGGGLDTIAGGAGADSFIIAAALGAANLSSIADFDPTQDLFLLRHAVFTGLGSSGTLPAAQFYAGTAAHLATDRIIYDNASGNIYYDADGNGAGAQVEFAHVHAGLAVSAADFHLIA